MYLYTGRFSPPEMAIWLIASLCSGAVLVSSFALFGCLSFWLGNATQLAMQATNAILTLALYPRDIFQGLVRFLMLTILPAAFVGAIPLDIVRRMDWTALLGLMAFAIGITLLLWIVFYAGLPVYAYSGTTYMNYNGTTNVSGLVTFTLPMGSYRFRADKGGTQFWSDTANHCTIPGCTSTVVTVSAPVVVSVRDTDGVPGVGLPMYAFSGTAYMNYNGTANASGQVTFTLPFGSYRFRADKSGTQFWSGASNHCAVPGCASTVVTVSVPVVVTVQDGSGVPQASVPVYAFDGSTYTNYNGTTNASGQVTLTLPFGNYRFRADKSGVQYWSGPSNHCAVPGCTSVTVTLATGGASNGGRALAQARLPVNDPGLLLLAPLAVLALSRRKGKRQRWATLTAAMLLMVAVMGMGTTLAGDDSAPVAVAALPDLPGLPNLEGLPRTSFAPQFATVVNQPAAAQVLTTTTTVIRYTYDPLQRLTSATYSDGKSFQYQYDAVGNRTFATQTITSTLVTTYTYDAANRLTSVNGQPHTWDANGNLLDDGSKTYLYNSANRLISVTAPGLTWSAAYNGDGARIKQTVNGADTVYTLDLAAPLPVVLQARTGSVSTQYVYGTGTRPLAQYDSSAWAYLLPDGLGSVRQLADANGDLTLIRSYEPYGNVLSSQGSATSVFGFTGEQTDDTGLVFLRARWFDSETGRFITQDLWPENLWRPQTHNKYIYANDNPGNYTDPTGLYSEGDIERFVNMPLFSFLSGTQWLHFLDYLGHEPWLLKAIKYPLLQDLYNVMEQSLRAGRYAGRELLPEFYSDIRNAARVILLNDGLCGPVDLELEASHLAIITIAYVPAKEHNMPVRPKDLWALYPRFLPDGRWEEPGWDKTGHFFNHAFLTFENLYMRNRQMPYYSSLDSAHEKLRWVNDCINIPNPLCLLPDSNKTGSCNRHPIEILNWYYNLRAGPIHVDDAPVGGWTSPEDQQVYLTSRDIGLFYEFWSSVYPFLPNQGIHYWIFQQHHPLSWDIIMQGSADPGLLHDLSANKLGAQFGIGVYHNPTVMPPRSIPR